ncbi:MAG: serine acetyltransferase [Polyangiaceae bacterium]|nr:serine acetyltransferase [Polyangiaceae bacterium]
MTNPELADFSPTNPTRNEPTPIVFDSVVNALSADDNSPLQHIKRSPCAEPLPSLTIVTSIVEELRSVLFPGYFDLDDSRSDSVKFHIGHVLDNVRRGLRTQIKRGICFSCNSSPSLKDCAARAQQTTDEFIQKLPAIRSVLTEDAIAAYEGDPAAVSCGEAVFCYPGLRAITDYRLAHELHVLGVPLLPRMITEYAHSRTGIDIHPGAKIGARFFIDHGTGIVIGETCVIGRDVRLYQGVTLGAKSFPMDEHGKPIKGIARHPILEDNVVVYAGATILGRVTIGHGSIIGGNVWLTRSLPPNSRVAQRGHRQELFVDGSGI